MTEKLKELIVAYVSKTQGKTPDEVSSLLFKKEADTEVVNEDALNALFELDKTRVQGFENKIREQHVKGYDKAKAESLSKFEKDIKDKFGITEEKQGLDLIDAVVAAKAKSSGVELDDDKIKASKLYNDTIDNLKKERDAAVKEWKEKFENREKQLQKEATFKTIAEEAKSIVKGLNPILPADEKKAERQLSILIKELEAEYEYEVLEGGKKILKKDGKVVQDDHGHPISFESIVKTKASDLWEFKQGDSRSGSGNKNEDGAGAAGSAKGYKGPLPKNEEEYMSMVNGLTEESAKIELTKQWVASQQKV
jgi:hypothetical protein